MNVQRPQYPPVGIGGPAGSPAPGMQRPPGPPGPQQYSGGMVRPPSMPTTPGSKRPASSSSSKRCVCVHVAVDRATDSKDLPYHLGSFVHLKKCNPVS